MSLTQEPTINTTLEQSQTEPAPETLAEPTEAAALETSVATAETESEEEDEVELETPEDPEC